MPETPVRGTSSATSGAMASTSVLQDSLTDINTQFTLSNVIRSFADSDTEQFYTTGRSRRFPPEIRKRAAMRLTQISAATRLEDLKQPPSNRLEALKCDRKGQWSIRINDRWRICFRFAKGNAHDVAIVDYH